MHGIRSQKAVDSWLILVTRARCIRNKVSGKWRFRVEEIWKRVLLFILIILSLTFSYVRPQKDLTTIEICGGYK